MLGPEGGARQVRELALDCYTEDGRELVYSIMMEHINGCPHTRLGAPTPVNGCPHTRAHPH